jgi:hypothetical protein
MEIEPSYSASIMKSYMLKNLDLGYEEHFSRIASSDHILPKALLHKLMTNIGGEINEPINVSSNVLNYFDEEQNIYSANTKLKCLKLIQLPCELTTLKFNFNCLIKF